MAVKLPTDWKGPMLDRYDGSIDPNEHINTYLTQVNMYTSDDAMLCRIFPTLLKGTTLSWFTRLLNNSIDCFDTLTTKLGAQFTASRPHHMMFVALVNIRQERSESLRAFMERFRKVALNIQNLNPKVAMHHLVTALKPGPFSDSLCMNSTIDIDELCQRAAMFMQWEEYRQQSSTKEMRPPRQTEGTHPKVGPSKPRVPKFSHYTPLNANRAQILEEALNTATLPTPRRILSPWNAYQSKHCKYHRNYSHTAEECLALKDKIEELI